MYEEDLFVEIEKGVVTDRRVTDNHGKEDQLRDLDGRAVPDRRSR